MADEYKLTIRSKLTNGGHSVGWFNNQLSVTQTAEGISSGVQTVGTSAENITTGDITTPGYLHLKNLDTTNYVEFGADNTGFVAVGKLKAGEEAVFRVAASTTIQLKADTASCNVAFQLLED